MNESALDGLFAVVGLVTGFMLAEMSAWRGRRTAGRKAVHALWIEVENVEDQVRLLVKDKKFATNPSEVEFELETLSSRFLDLAGVTTDLLDRLPPDRSRDSLAESLEPDRTSPAMESRDPASPTDRHHFAGVPRALNNP